MCEAYAITDFEICTLMTKSTEPCTKAKLGYFSKIEVDIDCLNRIETFKIPLEANEPCFWIPIRFWYNFARFSRKIKKSDILGYFILTDTVRPISQDNSATNVKFQYQTEEGEVDWSIFKKWPVWSRNSHCSLAGMSFSSPSQLDLF